jgi:hypothetical protein
MTARTLLTIRPGPVLHLWQDGREVARVPLDMHRTLALVEALLREVWATQARDRKDLDVNSQEVVHPERG